VYASISIEDITASGLGMQFDIPGDVSAEIWRDWDEVRGSAHRMNAPETIENKEHEESDPDCHCHVWPGVAYADDRHQRGAA
jgi:hypothetical protein